MALEDVGIEAPEEAKQLVFNPSEEMQTVLMTRLAEMTEAPEEQPQEEMRQIPPEETMGALKGIA